MKDEIFLIPEEVRSEVKFFKWLYMKDVVAIIISCVIIESLDLFVYPALKTGYIAMAGLLALILTRRSRVNPGKRVGASLAFYLLKRKQNLEYCRVEPEVYEYEVLENE